MSSKFTRAHCGCVGLYTGRPAPAPAGYKSEGSEFLTLWACDARDGSPYMCAYRGVAPEDTAFGTPLTDDEERELVGQLARRLVAAERMQELWSILQSVSNLNQGRTDASPCKD